MFFYYLTLTLFKTTIAAIIFVLTSCINGIFLINTTKGTVSLLNFSLKTSASFLSYVFINKARAAGPLRPDERRRSG